MTHEKLKELQGATRESQHMNTSSTSNVRKQHKYLNSFNSIFQHHFTNSSQVAKAFNKGPIYIWPYTNSQTTHLRFRNKYPNSNQEIVLQKEARIIQPNDQAPSREEEGVLEKPVYLHHACLVTCQNCHLNFQYVHSIYLEIVNFI